MGTSTIPNVRATADITIKTRLKDGGVALEWGSMTDVKAWLYSDAQKALAGRCGVSVDQEDGTLLLCDYSAQKPQYLGVNRIIVQCKYQGRTKTYDAPALNLVPRTAEATGELEISDPVVDVYIEVEDVSSSVLDAAIIAALDAAERANDAAEAAEHMVDIHQGPPGPAGKAPYIDETTGNWFVWDDQTEQYVDSGTHAQGETGNGIASWSVVESQEDGGSNVVTVVFTNGNSESFTVKNGNTGATPAISIGTVETGAAGSEAEASMTGTVANPVLNLKIPKGDPGVAEVCYKHVTNLPTAAAGTMNALYLVDTQTANVYDVYYTSYDGSAYSWVQLGTTTVNLSDYATKDELTQLEAKVDSLPRGKNYGFYTSSDNLPNDATEEGFAYVGATEPYAIWQFDGNTWTDSGVTANAFSANSEQVENAVDEYMEDHPAVSGTFLNMAKHKLIALLEKVAFIDGHGQDYIDELEAYLFLSPINRIDAVYTQGETKIYDIYSLDKLKGNLVVTVTYADGSQAVTTEYTLSGTLVSGTSTITVSVLDPVTGQTVTGTFDVVVTATTKLYMDGDECTALTGGWQNKGFNLTEGSPIASKETDHLLIKFNNSSNSSCAKTFSTTNAINISALTKIIVDYEVYNAAGSGNFQSYYPSTLSNSTSQSGAFGSDYSDNRNGLVAMGNLTGVVSNTRAFTMVKTHTTAYISMVLNMWSNFSAGAYVKIKKVALAAE